MVYFKWELEKLNWEIPEKVDAKWLRYDPVEVKGSKVVIYSCLERWRKKKVGGIVSIEYIYQDWSLFENWIWICLKFWNGEWIKTYKWNEWMSGGNHYWKWIDVLMIKFDILFQPLTDEAGHFVSLNAQQWNRGGGRKWFILPVCSKN